MKKTIYKTLLTSLILVASSHPLQAQESTKTLCSQAGHTRTIEVVYPQAEHRPACEVVYFNKSGSKVLWSAQNDASYCEQKAMEFIAKQESWGWDCKLEEKSQEKMEELEQEIESENEEGTASLEQEESENQTDEVNQEELEEDRLETQTDEAEQSLEKDNQETESTQTEQDLEAEKADVDAEIKKLKERENNNE